GEHAPTAPAPPQRRWGAAEEATGPPWAARAPVGVGGRWGRGGRLAGLGRRQTPGRHGGTVALGCRLGAPPSAPAPRHARPSPPHGEAPTPPAGGADRADTPWETVAVAWDSGQRQRLWGVARPAWWSTPKWPPVAVRFGLGGDPAGPLRMAACFGPDLQATPVQIVPWVVRRWCVEGTCEAGRAHLGRETQRPWSDQALARTPPGLLALFSLVTRLALQLSHGGPMPVAVTAWYHQPEPTVVECLAWVRRHLWRAQYVVHAAAAPAFVQFPRKALEGLLTGLSLAA